MPWIRPKHWQDFQHYTKRTPPWIKLHRRILDDYDFHCLPVASKALAPLLWLLASEDSEGKIELDYPRLSFRLHLSQYEIQKSVTPLIDKGFFECSQDASAMLAECKRDATLETEKRERRGEERIGAFAPPPNGSQNSIVNEAVELWNQTASKHDLPRIQKLTASRKKKLEARLSDCGGLDGWRAALEKICQSEFLLGKNDRGWKANFDFLVTESRFAKLMEGAYDGGGSGTFSSRALAAIDRM